MAAPSKIKLTIYQGSTFRWRATIKSGASADVAVVTDLTGYTARMQIRSDITSDTILFSLTTENGGITIGDAAGTVDYYISDTDTSAIDWDSAVYDTELIAPSGDVRRYFYGAVVVSPEVTR